MPVGGPELSTQQNQETAQSSTVCRHTRPRARGSGSGNETKAEEVCHGFREIKFKPAHSILAK